MYYYSTSTAYISKKDEIAFNEADLVYKVCEVMGVTPAQIATKSRKERIKYARWFIWSYLSKMGLTQYDIGRVFEGAIFDHSSISNACKKLPEDINRIAYLKAASKQIAEWYKSFQ